MSKQKPTDKPLFDNLRKLITLIDSFRDVGLQDHIQLPRIAVLGTQSSGKSSLLENIVGLDFLPRGSGVVTRRPLQLRMVHINNPVAKPYGVFEKSKDVPITEQDKIFDFDKIRDMIQAETDRVAGTSCGIVDDPIKLTVFSYECPDLTLIDLPGITRISVGNQIKDIEKVTIEMAKRYCTEERTIILAVIPANADMSTSQGLSLAREWDPKGTRTLGVITKIDLMDRGTEASSMLLNKEVPLKLGYVGIKNRSQEEINNKVKVAVALNNEEQYFKTHTVYRNLDTRFLGTRALTRRLTDLLEKSINTHLRSILGEVEIKAKDCQALIRSLGQPLPKDGKQRIYLLWKLLNDFSEKYRSSIKGKSKSNNTRIDKELQLSTGSIIKSMFEELYTEQSAEQYKASKDITDEDIERAIKNHQGDSIPGFPSIHAFLFLLGPKLRLLKEPALDLLNNIYTQLRRLCGEISLDVSRRAPQAVDQIVLEADSFLTRLKNEAETYITTNIQCECSYIFTNDQDYLDSRTKLIPDRGLKKKQQKAAVNAQGAKQQPAPKEAPQLDSKMDRERIKKEAEKMFVNELRLRVDHYFRIVVRTLRESIPKNIGYLLLEKSQASMQYEIYNQLLKNDSLVDQLSEPAEITQQRETASKTLEVLNKAKRIIKREISSIAQEEDRKDGQSVE